MKYTIIYSYNLDGSFLEHLDLQLGSKTILSTNSFLNKVNYKVKNTNFFSRFGRFTGRRNIYIQDSSKKFTITSRFSNFDL